MSSRRTLALRPGWRSSLLGDHPMGAPLGFTSGAAEGGLSPAARDMGAPLGFHGGGRGERSLPGGSREGISLGRKRSTSDPSDGFRTSRDGLGRAKPDLPRRDQSGLRTARRRGETSLRDSLTLCLDSATDSPAPGARMGQYVHLKMSLGSRSPLRKGRERRQWSPESGAASGFWLGRQSDRRERVQKHQRRSLAAPAHLSSWGGFAGGDSLPRSEGWARGRGIAPPAGV